MVLGEEVTTGGAGCNGYSEEIGRRLRPRRYGGAVLSSAVGAEAAALKTVDIKAYVYLEHADASETADSAADVVKRRTEKELTSLSGAACVINNGRRIVRAPRPAPNDWQCLSWLLGSRGGSGESFVTAAAVRAAGDANMANNCAEFAAISGNYKDERGCIFLRVVPGDPDYEFVAPVPCKQCSRCRSSASVIGCPSARLKFLGTAHT
jgi:hypothetical protein